MPCCAKRITSGGYRFNGGFWILQKKKAVGCGSRSVTPLRAPRLCVSPTLLRDSALQTSPCTSCASKALVAVFRAKKQATSFYACFSNTLVLSHRWPSLTRNTADILRVFEVRIKSKIFYYSLWNSSHRLFFFYIFVFTFYLSLENINK